MNFKSEESRLGRKAKSLSLAAALKTNYLLGNYRKTLWLIGDGRSGTTWLADLINYRQDYRVMFEPFHPEFSGQGHMQPHQYLRPSQADMKLHDFASEVFSGRLIHQRVDRENRPKLYKGLLIKDIFANLFAFWAWSQFPAVKPVLLIRNPFAVALSKLKKPDWFWTTNPMDIINQQHLFHDHLQPFEEIINTVCADDDPLLKLVLIWSIINYVPIRQFNAESLHVVFYEKLFADPNCEIQKIQQFMESKQGVSGVKIDQSLINRPSRVAGETSNLMTGKSPVTSWKNELSPQQIDMGYRILAHFGFDALYDEQSMPNEDVLFQARHPGFANSA